jgi:hypothetical protein
LLRDDTGSWLAAVTVHGKAHLDAQYGMLMGIAAEAGVSLSAVSTVRLAGT